MTLVLDAAPAAARAPPRRIAWRISGWDVLAIGALGVLWALLLLLHGDHLPIQLWDESRNANNALEMARHGHWLAPTYAGAVDHWNTKPPLLIWAQASLLRLGLPVLTALRLTSWLAAAATVGMVWGVLRVGLQDRLAAFAGGVLLLSAILYVGEHAARTGDYDALETAFMLGYTLSFWRAFEHGRTRWLVLAAGCMGLGVLTKGVAALLPLPGLAVYAFTRPMRLVALLKDVRTWAAAALFVAIAGGYYGLREAIDPGYLKAVAGNELGGRFMTVLEGHRGSWHFYITQLLLFAEPSFPLAALGFVTLFGADARRRRLVLACGLAGGSLLVVLSASRSKMVWYVTPLIPILGLIAGAGLSDGLRWVQAHARPWAPAVRGAAALALASGALFTVWWNQAEPVWASRERLAPQFRYGAFLDHARAQGVGPRITVVDTGLPNDAGYVAYNPMLKFYAELDAPRGLQVTAVHRLQDVVPGVPMGSCDPRALRSLRRAAPRLLFSGDGCELRAR